MRRSPLSHLRTSLESANWSPSRRHRRDTTGTAPLESLDIYRYIEALQAPPPRRASQRFPESRRRRVRPASYTTMRASVFALSATSLTAILTSQEHQTYAHRFSSLAESFLSSRSFLSYFQIFLNFPKMDTYSYIGTRLLSNFEL